MLTMYAINADAATKCRKPSSEKKTKQEACTTTTIKFKKNADHIHSCLRLIRKISRISRAREKDKILNLFVGWVYASEL